MCAVAFTDSAIARASLLGAIDRSPASTRRDRDRTAQRGHSVIGKRLASIGLGVVLLAGMGTSTAYAVTVTITGAKTVTSVASTYAWNVTSCDTANDGQFTSAPWIASNGIQGSVVNKKGAFTSYTEMVLGNSSVRLSSVKACRSNTLLPMSCTGWVATGY